MKVLSDRTAKWIVDAMGRKDLRPRLRRIAAAADTPSAAESCIPVRISSQHGEHSYEGYSFTTVAGTTAEASLIYFPHLSLSTEIPTGAVVLGHYVDTVAIQSSSDGN